MDKGYVNYTKLLNELKEKFGKKIAPFCIPIGEKDEFKGFVNVLIWLEEYLMERMC